MPEKRNGTCLFIGKLSREARVEDLTSVFGKYGTVARCDIKNGYAFVKFEEERDAQEALENLQSTKICGERINIEWAKGTRKEPRRDYNRYEPYRRRYSRSPYV